MTARRPFASTLLRLLAGLALLAFLLHTIGLDDLRSAAIPLKTHPLHIAAALLLTLAALLVGALRWQHILRILGIRRPPALTLRSYFIGQFFNAFLFGACGGDLARAIHIARDTPAQRTEAVTSVILDRAIGLLLTLLIGCLLIPTQPGLFTQHADTRPALWLMLGFLAIALAATALLLHPRLLRRTPLLRALHRSPRIAPHIERIETILHHLRTHPRTLLTPALLSLANLLLLMAATAALARAIETPIPLHDLLLIYPVITVLAAIPLTPGSLGIRETLYITLLAPLGIPPGPALLLSLLTYLTGTTWSIASGLTLLKK